MTKSDGWLRNGAGEAIVVRAGDVLVALLLVSCMPGVALAVMVAMGDDMKTLKTANFTQPVDAMPFAGCRIVLGRRSLLEARSACTWLDLAVFAYDRPLGFI